MIRSLLLAMALLGQTPSEPGVMFGAGDDTAYSAQFRWEKGADGKFRPANVILMTGMGRFQYVMVFEAQLPPSPVPVPPIPGPTPGPTPTPTPDPPTPTPTPTPAVYAGPMIVTIVLPADPSISQAAIQTDPALRSAVAAAQASFASYRLGASEISDPRWKEVFAKYPPPAAFFQKPDGSFVVGGIIDPTPEAIINRLKSIRGK